MRYPVCTMDTETKERINLPEVDPEMMDSLANIVGQANVSSSLIDRITYSRDIWPQGYLWLRKGRLPHVPEAVVWPRAVEDVSGVIRWCAENKVPITPEGGGSGVCGGSVPMRGGMVMDLKKMHNVLSINNINHTVEAQAGIMGETLERRLNQAGFTMGHFPASMYCSTLGGWLSTRSAGQLSSKYGKIEDMFISLSGVLPDGTVFRSKDSPRSATGPDLDQLVVGSEGTLAVVTSAVMAVHPLPEWRRYRGFMVDDMDAGIEAMRMMMRHGLDPSVARLYDPLDTRLHKKSMDIQADGCLMITGFEGPDNALTRAKADKGFYMCERRGRDLGEGPGLAWLERRYSVSYYQSVILSQGHTILDTCEVAATWSRVPGLYKAVRDAIMPHAMVTAHVSHVYPVGAAIYFTFLSTKEEPPAEEVYKDAWNAAMKACLDAGGAISHHHGIGAHKARWMQAELGPAMDIYKGLKKELDKANVLNPEKLGLYTPERSHE